MKRLFYLLFILLAIFAGGVSASLAQSGKSIMIYNEAKPGTQESSVGNAFEQALISGLQEKYPCVDWMNEQAMRDAIQKLREKEILTGELRSGGTGGNRKPGRRGFYRRRQSHRTAEWSNGRFRGRPRLQKSLRKPLFFKRSLTKTVSAAPALLIENRAA
jgi:hypothetical protein